jgi:hypothetical protein
MNDLILEIQKKLSIAIDGIGSFQDVAVLRHETLPQWIAILRECSDNKKWRIQRFDKDGFIGHEVYKDKDEAIKNAARERYTIRDDAALDRMAATPMFCLGNEISSLRDKLNAGVMKWSEYLKETDFLRKGYAL